ncbi:MAG: acetylornithine carbamoyltransferase, partial [Planctomycetes bacterium]|nr:acetylornithine carbamoyltransferase [Planctomycetota bacterium]
PCQGLTDLMTLRELFPSGLSGKKVVLTWVPHVKPLTQSVGNSFLYAAALSGANVTLAHPEGFDLQDDAIAAAKALCDKNGAKLSLHFDQDAALQDADVVYAKSWVSSKWYGDWESELAIRNKIDADWRLTADKMSRTHRAKFMHPLPIRRNLSVDDALLDGGDCVAYQQAENRLHLQKALLLGLLE